MLSNYSAVFEKIRGQLKKTFKNNFSFEYLSEILKIIKSEGGFLNHIRPEMLIFYEEYLENLKSRAEGCETVFEYYKTMDRVQFERSYKRCWVILFYQIFKVYSQINVGKLKTGTPFYAKFTTR